MNVYYNVKDTFSKTLMFYCEFGMSRIIYVCSRNPRYETGVLVLKSTFDLGIIFGVKDKVK